MNITSEQIRALLPHLIPLRRALPKAPLDAADRAYYNGLLFMGLSDHVLASALCDTLEAWPELFPEEVSQVPEVLKGRDLGRVLVMLHLALMELTQRVGDLALQVRGECVRKVLDVVQRAEEQITGTSYPTEEAYDRVAALAPVTQVLAKYRKTQEVKPKPIGKGQAQRNIKELMSRFAAAIARMDDTPSPTNPPPQAGGPQGGGPRGGGPQGPARAAVAPASPASTAPGSPVDVSHRPAAVPLKGDLVRDPLLAAPAEPELNRVARQRGHRPRVALALLPELQLRPTAIELDAQHPTRALEPRRAGARAVHVHIGGPKDGLDDTHGGAVGDLQPKLLVHLLASAGRASAHRVFRYSRRARSCSADNPRASTA